MLIIWDYKVYQERYVRDLDKEGDPEIDKEDIGMVREACQEFIKDKIMVASCEVKLITLWKDIKETKVVKTIIKERRIRKWMISKLSRK